MFLFDKSFILLRIRKKKLNLSSKSFVWGKRLKVNIEEVNIKQ